MRYLIVLLLIAAAWGGYRHFHASEPVPMTPIAVTATPSAAPSTPALPTPAPSFSCDGRQHCSEMRSCEEATFFIRNCPDTKMDGNNDGVPCESQWCG